MKSEIQQDLPKGCVKVLEVCCEMKLEENKIDFGEYYVGNTRESPHCLLDGPFKDFLVSCTEPSRTAHEFDELAAQVKIRINSYACELVNTFQGLDEAQIKLDKKCLESTPEFLQVMRFYHVAKLKYNYRSE